MCVPRLLLASSIIRCRAHYALGAPIGRIGQDDLRWSFRDVECERHHPEAIVAAGVVRKRREVAGAKDPQMAAVGGDELGRDCRIVPALWLELLRMEKRPGAPRRGGL